MNPLSPDFYARLRVNRVSRSLISSFVFHPQQMNRPQISKTRFFFTFLLCGSLLSFTGQSCFAQAATKDSTNKNLIGTIRILVTNIENGLPIDSAQVTIGSGRKGYTDKNGILLETNVYYNTIITVNYTGYLEQSIKVSPNMKFRMLKTSKAAGTEQGKISNGMFSRPEEHFAGSATTYSGDRLRQLNSINILEGLSIVEPSFIAYRNNLNGDNPNTLHQVELRGQRHFPANATVATSASGTAVGVQITPSAGDFIAEQVKNPNQPLILLDGMQISLQQLGDMDIFRIDKVTILKDASATAMYGSRAANGVVLVQTKLPAKGNFKLTYTGQVQISTPDLGSYNLMEAAEKLELEKTAGMYTGNDALYQQRLKAVQSGVNTDWLKVPTQTGVGTRHNINLQGGDESLQYGLDFGYNQLDGAMKGSSRKNTNLGAFVAAQVKNIYISNYLAFNQTAGNNSPYGPLSLYAGLNPYWSNVDSLTGGYPKFLEEYKISTPNGDSTITTFNPAYNTTLATTSTTAYTRFSNLTRFGWIIGNGFDLAGRIAVTSNKDVADLFLPPSHSAFAHFTPDQFFKRGIYNQTESNFNAYEAALQLNYKHMVGLHQFYGTTGVLGLSTKSNATGINVQGFTSDQIANISFGSAYTNTKPATGKVNTSLLSGFVNLGYSYDTRYQLDATFTRDGSSQFGEDSRYAHYYALAASWNVHNERFMSGIGFINLLRLKASYGSVGSSFYQTYLGNTTYNYYTNQQYIPGTGTGDARGVGLGAFLTGLGNQNLQSPQVEKQNFSLDAGLFNNRLFIHFEQFSETSEKLVLPLLSPSSTGLSNFRYYDNLGSISNKGFEWSINYAIISDAAKGLLWNIGANGLHTTHTIEQMDGGYLDALNAFYNSSWSDQTRPQPKYAIGHSLTAIWAVPSLGIDPATGKEQFRKADGSTTNTWDAADKINAGDMMPEWQGSFGTSLTWKRASLGAWFYYQTGGQVYNQTLADKIENADLTYNVDQRAGSNRWQQPGDNATYKALSLDGLATDPTFATTRFVEDAGFLNSASLSFGYSLPSFKSQKIPLQQTSFRFTANHSLRTSSVDYERGIAYPFASFYSFTISTSIK